MTATTTQTPTQTPTMTNGVNVTALMKTIEAVRSDPTLGHFEFRTTNRWLGGGLNRSTIGTFHGTHMEHTRTTPFVYTNDEPPVLLGEDRGANPVEYVLHALAGCMTTTMAYKAAGLGIDIESIESRLEGDVDLNGLLQTQPGVPSGYKQIRVTFKVKTKGDAEMLKKLCQLSPVYDTLTRPVNVQVNVETTT
jgi:uncharacterized OsmC-like protein